MALDRVSLPMLAPKLKGAAVLCLAYPDIAIDVPSVEAIFKVKINRTAAHGLEHKGASVVPETVSAFMSAGAVAVDCVDVKAFRGVERIVDLNVRQEWPKQYDVVINPGTIEHCFDIATAWFNAWRAVKVGGSLLQVAPLNMINHGFWNVCPTAFFDFCVANGGKVTKLLAADRLGGHVAVEPHMRYAVHGEAVLYAMLEKREAVAEEMPVQWRYRR